MVGKIKWKHQKLCSTLPNQDYNMKSNTSPLQKDLKGTGMWIPIVFHMKSNTSPLQKDLKGTGMWIPIVFLFNLA